MRQLRTENRVIASVAVERAVFRERMTMTR
jgi:hypothetical protein